MDPEERGGGEEVGGVEQGETVIKKRCLRKEPISNKRGGDVSSWLNNFLNEFWGKTWRQKNFLSQTKQMVSC